MSPITLFTRETERPLDPISKKRIEKTFYRRIHPNLQNPFEILPYLAYHVDYRYYHYSLFYSNRDD